MGKMQEGPVTRSRISEKDFTTSDEWSSFTNIQELKRRKKDKLDHLKHNDMFLMSAGDEDSAISVQNHITRKFRKRKATPLIRD